MSIKVIGAGFGRTGTDSMREALNTLGFGPCHHMFEVNAHEDQKRLWRAVVRGVAPDWNRLFQGYGACVDWPSSYYWRELMTFYPDAKVVLTYRSAESWWKSFEQTILIGIQTFADSESLAITLVRDKVFNGRPQDRERALAIYEANIKAVKATVPKDRLLVHNLGDGWETLCEHLGVPIPNEPYPSRNNSEQFKEAVLSKPR